jgi:elongation factor 1-alpha
MNGIKASELKRGCIIGEFDSNPPKIVQEFTAQIVVMDAVGDIANGYAPVLHIHTTSQQCTIT